MSLEKRFETLKEVMINNLERIHDIIVDTTNESKKWYEEFEKKFDIMIKSVKEI